MRALPRLATRAVTAVASALVVLVTGAHAPTTGAPMIVTRALVVPVVTVGPLIAPPLPPTLPVAAALTSGPFPRLTHTYTFGGPKPDADWSVYNSAWTGSPDLRNPSMVTVSGGVLHVATSGRTSSGLCLCGPGAKPTQPYGGWEIRARATPDADHGFAMLLWPNAENWPAGGEIDIAEYNPDRSKVTFTVHYDRSNLQKRATRPGDFTRWHTYRVDWTPTAIRYFIDGVLTATVTDAAAVPHAAMHLCLQAGANGSHPSGDSARLDIAWVRSYSA